MALSMRTPLGLRTPALPASRSRAVVVCKAQAEEQSFASKLALPMATFALATCMMMSPDEALAARSSGRVGGSSGFKSRAAPSAAPQQSRTTVNNTTIVSPGYAPPLFGGFGYGGFGYSFMPSFVMPFPFFGGIFQFFFLLTIMSVVFSVIRGFMNNGSSKSNKKDDDSWGDL